MKVISFVESGSEVSSKYHESYTNGVSPKKVMLHGKFEIGAIVNHCTYSPDMDTSGGARVFKINPLLNCADHNVALFAEDLLKIIEHGLSSVGCIPEDIKSSNDN